MRVFLKTNDDHRHAASFPLRAAYCNKHSKLVRLSTCSWLRSSHPHLSKRSHWPLALIDIHSRLSSICWCCTAGVIGCSLPVFTGSRRRTWKYLPPLLWTAVSFFLLLLPQWSLRPSGVRVADACAVRSGDNEKLHSLQKSWNYIKQIEKLMPPRDQFNYINVLDFWNSAWHLRCLICCCFPVCLHVRLEVLLSWIYNIQWIKIRCNHVGLPCASSAANIYVPLTSYYSLLQQPCA